MISATSIDKTAQLLMDNRQDLHFDNEYKIFAFKRFQLKLVKSFPMPLCVSTTDTLCHWNIVRYYRTELCKQGTSDNATTESDYIVFILQRNSSISTTSRHGNHHTFTRAPHREADEVYSRLEYAHWDLHTRTCTLRSHAHQPPLAPNAWNIIKHYLKRHNQCISECQHSIGKWQCYDDSLFEHIHIPMIYDEC